MHWQYFLPHTSYVKSKDTHLVNIDLSKVYDSIPNCKLWEIIEENPISINTVKAVKHLFENYSLKIKICNLMSMGISVTKDLWQGCHLYILTSI